MPAGIGRWQNGSMPELHEVSLQVRHVPADVHAILRKRAVLEGKSLQEYVLGLLVAQAHRPTRHEVLARAGRRAGGHFSMEQTVEILRSEREAR